MSIPSEVFQQTLGELLAPALRLFREPQVSEVLVNAWDDIYVERCGVLEATSGRFASEHHLMSALKNLSQYVGRELSAGSPILEARLPDGTRVQAVIPPASPSGPIATIRRPASQRLTLQRLRELGALDESTERMLKKSVREKRNILVSGGSGTGKTTFLSALISSAKRTDRIVVIEDSRELSVDLPHVVTLESQPAGSKRGGSIGVRQLFSATLRMRADRIVIGEVRGDEALDLVQAMTSGHRGCLSSLHGTRPIDALRRLEAMALMSDVSMPVDLLRGQIASAVDLVVQLARVERGLRCVTHIAEVHGFRGTRGYDVEHLFERERDA